MLWNAYFLTALATVFVTRTHASHFLGGSITWKIKSTNTTHVNIIITQTYSWTYTVGRCDGTAISTNALVSGSGGSLMCSPICPTNFGLISTAVYCTDVSPSNGIAVGQRLDTVSIPVNSNFSTFYTGSAWGSLATGGTIWSILTHIHTNLRSDNGQPNNSPVATIMSPINLYPNKTKLIRIPVRDTDGDDIRCRWAGSGNNTQECGSVCAPAALPPNITLYSNCSVEVAGTTVGSKYALAIMVEDFIDQQSSNALSSIPVQVIVNVVSFPSCATPPEIIPLDSDCITVKVNESFHMNITAKNQCGQNVSILDIATLSISGMNKSNIQRTNDTIFHVTILWTPTLSQLGYQIICAMAINSQYAQSNQYCITFYVSMNESSLCSMLVSSTESPSKPSSINWIVVGSIVGFSILLCMGLCLIIIWFIRKRSNRRDKNRKTQVDLWENPFYRDHRQEPKSDAFSIEFNSVRKLPNLENGSEINSTSSVTHKMKLFQNKIGFLPDDNSNFGNVCSTKSLHPSHRDPHVTVSRLGWPNRKLETIQSERRERTSLIIPNQSDLVEDLECDQHESNIQTRRSSLFDKILSVSANTIRRFSDKTEKNDKFHGSCSTQVDCDRNENSRMNVRSHAIFSGVNVERIKREKKIES